MEQRKIMEQEDMEIDLINLLFYMLRRWRMFLLAALCGALILGGYKAVSAMRVRLDAAAVEEAQKQYELDKEAYEKTKTGYERDIETLTASLDARTQYIENSVFMKINPFDQWNARVDVLIKVPDANTGLEDRAFDETDSYVKLYAQGINKLADMEKLSRELGIEKNYLDELIDIDADYNSNTISISVTGASAEFVDRILDELINQINKQKQEIDSKVGTHSVEFLNRTTNQSMNQGLADRQKSENDSITSLQNSLTDKEKALHDIEEPSLPEGISGKEMLKNSIKFAIIGLVLGIFVVGGINCGYYILRGRLHESDEISTVFGINVLGVFPKTLSSKRAFSGIDRWLLKLENGNERSDEEVALRIALAAERKLDDTDKVLLTGNVKKSELDKVQNLLSANLPKLQILVGEDMTENVETVRQLKTGINKVILVEQREYSAMNKIKEEISTIDEQGVEIVGGIVL